MIERSLNSALALVLERYHKMAFVSGPRQVGKTTLARTYLKRFGQGVYFNWDVVPDQKRLVKSPYFFEEENRNTRKPFLVVLDEIHKYGRWKNYLKGAYDRYHAEFRFLVTGSGRLDLFKRGGDSLMGRYMALPLFPLSLGEVLRGAGTLRNFREGLHSPPEASKAATEACRRLFRFSGFPEPFLKGETRFYDMWSGDRKALLIRDDIRSTTTIRDLSLLEMLSHLIPERVGSPLSINSLREDVGVSFEAVRDWLEILARFYYLFRISPYTGSLARALKKETKVYLYDWGELADDAKRFENMVALHLFKAVRTWRAQGDGDLDLFYIRDKEKREVDFVLTENRRPICLIECKLGDLDLSRSLIYFQEKLGIPTAIQLVHREGISRKLTSGTYSRWILSADRWLSLLP